MAKKRQKRKELLQAGNVARELLEEKGLQHTPEKSVIDQILASKNAPLLPGIPAYLPRVDTIHVGRWLVRCAAREWQAKTKDNPKRQGNAIEFFRFFMGIFEELERKVGAQIVAHKEILENAKKKNMSYSIKEIFEPVQQRTYIRGLRTFILDSFAVSIVAKRNGDTSEYVEWFLGHWTEQLLLYWPEKLRDGSIFLKHVASVGKLLRFENKK